MSFNGDIAKLTSLAKNVSKLPLAIRNRVAIAATKEINELLHEQFEEGIGPDGEPWQHLADSTIKRGRKPPPLTDTGKMRDSVRAVRHGTNVVIEADFPAQAHQSGRGVPHRPIWPKEGEAMPERYETRLSYSATTAILEALNATGLKAAE